jgi:hypothetical protein
MPILDVQVAGPGAMTIAAVSNIFREHPILEMMKRKQGLQLAENVRAFGTVSHDDLMKKIRQLVQEISLST